MTGRVDGLPDDCPTCNGFGQVLAGPTCYTELITCYTCGGDGYIDADREARDAAADEAYGVFKDEKEVV